MQLESLYFYQDFSQFSDATKLMSYVANVNNLHAMTHSRLKVNIGIEFNQDMQLLQLLPFRKPEVIKKVQVASLFSKRKELQLELLPFC